MNKEVYEKNMEMLRKKFPAWADFLIDKNRKKRNFDVIAEESLTGEIILKVCQNGKIFYLNGKYAPSAVVDKWLKDQGEIEEFAAVIIIGISNGEQIRRIIKASPPTVNILIYEPSYEIFRRAMQEVDLTFLFEEDIPVGIVVEGINEFECDAFVQRFVTYDNFVFLHLYISGNYIELFEELINKMVKRLTEHISALKVTWNTIARYTTVKADNFFHNLPFLYQGYSVDALGGILPEDVPVIVVSAGPSLNRNIMDLKKAEGKACIIATDTAMKPLLNAGIVPHLFMIVDGLKPAELFMHKGISKSGMVTMTGVSVEPMKMHKGKKFFYYSGSDFETKILDDLSRKELKDKLLPNLPTGGSVATSAYSLGAYMGTKTIILVGQDLAMTGNKTHADGTFQEKMDDIDVDSSEYFEVESVDGGKVLTRGDFKLYLDWFEKYIDLWKENITTIDATEGGALIHGAKVMTLKKAVQKCCVREFNVKWHIDHSKKIFSKGNEEVALEHFINSEKKLEEVRKKAKEGLKYYKKLEKLVKKKSFSDAEMHKLLGKIKDINHYMEDDYMAETVIGSLKGVELMLRPLIYQVQKDKNSELADIAEQGKVMMFAVSVAAEEICQIARETVVPFAKEQRGE